MQRPKDDSRANAEAQEEWTAACEVTPCVVSVAAVDGLAATAAAPSTDATEERALSVTRPAEISVVSQNPHLEDCRVLLAGIDTLDLGMYVEFGANWSRIVSKLAQLKRAARGTGGRLIGGNRCVINPGGKPNYPFLVQYPDFQLYLSRKSKPEDETPNAFVSLNSEFLWRCGEEEAIERVKNELFELTDGKVTECRMSRCDLTVDALIPAGLTDQFIRTHAVTHVQQYRTFHNYGRLETLYVGGTGSDILLRIYDKSAESIKNEKEWFLPLWGLERNADVWRFEFQIRRPILKVFRINSLEELRAKRADLWQYLTETWFTLRLLDNPNASRRTVHPLWEMLQQCTERFGPTTIPLKRQSPQPSLDPSRPVNQAAGALVGVAVRTNKRTLDEALQELNERLRQEFGSRSFDEALHRKAIDLGVDLNQEDAA